MYKTSRQRILEYLEKRDTVSAGELAQVFRMTGSNVRHHLSRLVEEGVVLIVGVNKDSPGGHGFRSRRGRPEQLYGLRREKEANNLEQLTSILLSFVASNSDSDDLLKGFAEQLSNGEVEGKTMTLRLQQAVRRLNIMNYRTRWEARADAPRLVLGHCPYASIQTDHPELCILDEKLMAALLGADVSRISILEEVQAGIRQCVFKVKQNQGFPQR